MKTNNYKLPGVRFIGYVFAGNLQPDIALKGMTGMNVPILTDIHSIEFYNEPTCECNTQKEGGVSTETAKLKFISEEQLPIYEKLAFIVKSNDGECYIIGAKEAPYVNISKTKQLGTTNSNACCEYEITHSAIKTLVSCLI